MLKVNQTVTIKGQEFTVTEVLPVGPNVARELGVVGQYVVEGRRGATRLLQEFDNQFRTIDLKGRTQVEFK